MVARGLGLRSGILAWSASILILCFSSFELCVAQEFPPTVRKEYNTSWEVSGLVTDTQSRPLSGVKVYMARSRNYQAMQRQYAPTIKVSTDRSGHFSIPVSENQNMVFYADGYAPKLSKVPDGSAIDIELEKGRTVSGTISSPDGQPAVGATVTPVRWIVPNDKQAEPFSLDQGYGQGNNLFGLFPNLGADIAVKTDDQGKFAIPNLPDSHRVILSVKALEAREKVICVRGENDNRGEDFPLQVLEENEFTVQLETSAVLRLQAVDENDNPVEVGTVTLAPTIPGFSRYHQIMGVAEKVNAFKASVNLLPSSNGAQCWVEPSDTKQFLGFKFELPSIGEAQVVERKIKFLRGKTIRGIVTSLETRDPIENVKVLWRSLDMKDEIELTEKGEALFTKYNCHTNKYGEFEFAVPDQDGFIGVSGNVKGFVCASDWTGSRVGNAKFPYIDDLRNEFAYQLRKEELDSMGAIEFKLRANSNVSIHVVDVDGRPARNCVVTTSEAGRPVTVTTDVNGDAKLEDLYGDANKVAAIRYLDEIKDSDPQGIEDQTLRMRLRYITQPTKIVAFTNDGLGQGQVVLPLPDPDAESNEISVAIQLLAPGSVLGQVVDVNDEPVAELEVVARSGKSLWGESGQMWTTKTNQRGFFKMVGLTVGGEVNWQLEPQRVKTLNGKQLELDTSELKNGETLEVPTIKVQDFKDLLAELPELEIRGLSKEKTLEKILEYIKTSVQKAQIQKFDRRTISGGYTSSNSDPVPMYLNRVAEKVRDAVIELADRDPGSDFELAVLLGVPAAFPQSGIGMTGSMSSGVSNLNHFCLERLMKNQITNEKAQALILQLLGGGEAFYRPKKQWEQVFNESPFDETKAVASFKLVEIVCRDLTQQFTNELDDEKFESMLAELKKYLDFASEHSAAEGSNWNRQMEYIVKNVSFTFEQVLKPGANPNSQTNANDRKVMEKRAKAILDLVEDYHKRVLQKY